MNLKEHYKWKEYINLPLIELIKEYETWIDDIAKEEISYKIYQYYLKHKCLTVKQKEQIVAKLVDLYVIYDLDEGMVI